MGLHGNQSSVQQPVVITKVGVTDDTMTGRGGLNLFVKYIESMGIIALLCSRFGWFRKSKKGLEVGSLFTQLMSFFCDGTSPHLSHFDHLKKDPGYAGVIETCPDEMASSHQIKRFFSCFSRVCCLSFRWVLRRLFLWRLLVKKPSILFVMLDTMVMDNDDAVKREGVSPTYKKKKGFQPLHLIWEGLIVDALFRGGSKHGNHGRTVKTMLTGMVRLVRKHYSQSVPIIIRMDSGFYDEEILQALDGLDVGFLLSGKLYNSVTDYIQADRREFEVYDNGHQQWDYKEFGFRGKTWHHFYRAVFTRVRHDGPQYLFDFARPDQIILTNIGVNPTLDKMLVEAGFGHLRQLPQIIENHHQRGADELPHRALKEFASQKLPFQKFAANTAWYYCMIIAFLLFESFKQDHLVGLVRHYAYPTTVRRTVLDIAAKIVRSKRSVTLKVSQAVMDRLNFAKLWQNCCSTTIPLPRMIE